MSSVLVASANHWPVVRDEREPNLRSRISRCVAAPHRRRIHLGPRLSCRLPPGRSRNGAAVGDVPVSSRCSRRSEPRSGLGRLPARLEVSPGKSDFPIAEDLV